MLSKKVKESLNEQMIKEIYSGYLYLGMAAYAESIKLKGFSSWFYGQWKEELIHAKKIFDYISEKNERVILTAIDKPPQDFSSAPDLFEKTLAHEKNVTKMIHGLVELAGAENDKATVDFLQWFVKEQIEEESTPAGILEKIKSAEKNGKGLREIDEELAARK